MPSMQTIKYITAEGPSSELATGFLGAVCERPTGHTYPAPTEPARMRSGLTVDEWLKALGDRAQKPFIYRDETEQLRERLKEVEDANALHLARIRSQAEDNAVYKGFWKQEQGEHKRLGELAAGLQTQLDAANLEKQGLNATIDALTMDTTVLAKQVREARTAVKEFLEIGKRDLSNPKYNDYWEALADIDAGQKGGK